MKVTPGAASASGSYDDENADGVWRELPEDEVMRHVADAFAKGAPSDTLNVTNCPHEGWFHHTWEGGESTYAFCRRIDGKWFVAVDPI